MAKEMGRRKGNASKQGHQNARESSIEDQIDKSNYNESQNSDSMGSDAIGCEIEPDFSGGASESEGEDVDSVNYSGEKEADVSDRGGFEKSNKSPSDDKGLIPKDSKKKSKMVAEAKKFAENMAKRGVVYMGRVPPFMKPNKVRSIFENHGEVTRIFLQEEDDKVRRKRIASGGNAAKQFVEGWIEFAEKKVAKNVAASLHNTLIGGKKRSFYHDDMWNLKYLKGFKWDHLTEKFAYERRVREAKLRAAMIEARKQNAEFASLVEQNKVLGHIRERIESKKRKAGDDGKDIDEPRDSKEMAEISSASGKKRRKFRQFTAIAARHGENETQATSRLLKRVFAADEKAS